MHLLQLIFLLAMGIPNFSAIGILSGIQSTTFIVAIMILSAGIAAFSVARGVIKMWYNE